MYNNEILNNDFFECKNNLIDDILDPLTKAISRKYITNYVENLITNNVPFSIQIIDSDNFKGINDNYGHQSGDEILIQFVERMQQVLSLKKGYIGRIGGDEFLIVIPYLTNYDDVKKFISENYFGDNKPFRNKYNLGNKEIFITGTIGSASFPLDAIDYDSLLRTIDKALYRGKVKGRNCYIIYVESKHKYINANELTKLKISEMISETIRLIDEANNNFEKQLSNLNDYCKHIMKFSSLEYFLGDEEFGNIDMIFNNKGIFFTNHIDNIKRMYPDFYNYLNKRQIVSFLILKIKNKEFLMFTEQQIQRMWQDEHIALLMVIGKLLTLPNVKGEKND